uniref:Uncharacterized protein n=1 Tax=viral metagenome TaxID=1070528 RepID=A0A6C0BLW3_9ZZZZ
MDISQESNAIVSEGIEELIALKSKNIGKLAEIVEKIRTTKDLEAVELFQELIEHLIEEHENIRDRVMGRIMELVYNNSLSKITETSNE